MRSLMKSMSVAAFAASVLAVNGCDSADIDAIVNDATNQISQVTETAPVTETPETAAPAAVSPAEPVAVVPTPAVPPEQLVQTLMTTQSERVTGGQIKAVAESPEAALMMLELDLSGTELSAAEIAPVAAMKNLQKLTLSAAAVEVSGLSFIPQLSALNSLVLDGTKADDALLEGLAQLPHLRSLSLKNCQITSAGLRHPGSMAELQELNLEGTRVTDGLAILANASIQTLSVRNTAISDAALQEIASIPTLTALDVSRTRITGAGCKALARTSLKSFNASSTAFGVQGLVSIKGLKSIEELILFDCGITEDQKANVFRGYPNLRVLNIGGNAISDAGMHVLIKGLKNLERLEIANLGGLTDRGIEALVTCKKLNYLDCQGGRVSPDALGMLKKALQNPDMVTFPSAREF